MRNYLTLTAILLALTACQAPKQVQHHQNDAGTGSDAQVGEVGPGTTEVSCTQTEVHSQTYNDSTTTSEVFYDIIRVPGLTMTSGHTVFVSYCDYEAFKPEPVVCDNPARVCRNPRPTTSTFCTREIPLMRDGEVLIECGYRHSTTAEDGISIDTDGYRYNLVFLHIGSL